MASACKEAVPVPEQFPVGLKVLVVDDDITCLKILEQMLRKCMYSVTTCSQATVALNLLRERKGFFDIVLSDVHMPDMDGFKLLELVGLEMDLPVIMMSGDDRTSLVMRGIRHGACDYLIKPIRTEELKNIWQHVVRKRCNVNKEHEHSGSLEDNDQHKHVIDDAEYACSVDEGTDGVLKTSRKRKDTKEEDDAGLENDDPTTSKKPRVVWTVELHQQFVSAVNHLGIDKAVPKRILELMNVPNLTRENVASHLQKFRLYLKRLSGVQQQGGLPSSYCGPLEPSPKVGSLGRFDIQTLAASGQIPTQTLAVFHAELSNRPTGNLELPVMDQPALLQASLPVSKCINLDQNVAYGQPLMKCPSNISKQFSQIATSADNGHSGLRTWSSQNLVNVVTCENVTGIGAQNCNLMSIMHQEQQQQRQQQVQQQKQFTLLEPSHSINVQPSCLVVPSHSSANFQVGNSLASINQNCSYSGSSIIDYSILSPQLNNSPLGTGRISDIELKPTGMLSGLSGAGSISPTLSSASVTADNGVGMQVQNPASRFCPARQLPALVPNVSVLQDSYNASVGQMLDNGILKNTAFVGRGTSIPTRFAVDETGLPISNVNPETMYGENNGNKVKQKQELNMNFVEKAKMGVPILQRLSRNDLMSVFSD